ncbi:choline kinase [Christiangramia gaetbulicola]|uniref:Choline kinase n=1 Tax=Christiangramia gaetbulicola TaxID=703340 RepID=A0A2T6AFN2_9FLAO|nr:phosphocholine cytidylyltransferase family protein [Christiangramia gaetbulicola]PTX42614.1 choline kinase [Christiangramia gaetbulicola]
MNKYKGLILAAGRGSRMGSTTERSHKCLTILEGKTLLDWQLSALRAADVQDITVVRGYRSEMLQGDFKTAENPRWSETNMVGTLFCAPKMETETIISYSDIVYSSDHIEKLKNQDGDIVITADKKWLDLWSTRFENPLDDAESFKTNDGVLTEIGNDEDSIDNIQAQYMGLIKFTPRGWDIAFGTYNSLNKDEQDKLDMTSFLSMLMEKTDIKVAFIEGRWCEVDSNDDVKAYEIKLKENKNWSHDWRK